MEMLRKLMNMINLKWAQKSRINKTLTIQRGAGSYPYLTIRNGSVYFHAYPMMEKLYAPSEEVVKNSTYEGYATTTEQSSAFKADFIESVRNDGTDDIFINFNLSVTEPSRITLKPGESVTDFPRRVSTLYFSSNSGSQPFRITGTYTNLPYYQEVVLDGLSIREFKDVATQMEYLVDTSEAERLGLIDESALILMDTEGQLLSEWADIYAFTSNWYRVLYPIHRVLTQFDGDVDLAIEQIILPSARGEWLDYWASFFRIRRLPDESDELMLRRVFLTLTSAKSNNMAMEELVSFYIGTETKVLDNAPSQIEVRVDPQFMDSATKVREIIGLLKSAGVDYFINYQKPMEENYKVYYMDRYGKSFGTMNDSFSGVQVTLPVYTEDYLYVPLELRSGFILNNHSLNSDRLLSRPDIRVIESLSMTLKDGATGTIIQQI